MSDKTPIKTFRCGGVSASVWEREHKGKPFYNVALLRNYRDEHGHWKSTSSFTLADLPQVQALAEIAFRYVLSLQAGDMEAEADDEADAA